MPAKATTINVLRFVAAKTNGGAQARPRLSTLEKRYGVLPRRAIEAGLLSRHGTARGVPAGRDSDVVELTAAGRERLAEEHQ